MADLIGKFKGDNQPLSNSYKQLSRRQLFYDILGVTVPCGSIKNLNNRYNEFIQSMILKTMPKVYVLV